MALQKTQNIYLVNYYLVKRWGGKKTNEQNLPSLQLRIAAEATTLS